MRDLQLLMPSYRATRVLWELVLETLPMSVLQLHVRAPSRAPTNPSPSPSPSPDQPNPKPKPQPTQTQAQAPTVTPPPSRTLHPLCAR